MESFIHFEMYAWHTMMSARARLNIKKVSCRGCCWFDSVYLLSEMKLTKEDNQDLRVKLLL